MGESSSLTSRAVDLIIGLRGELNSKVCSPPSKVAAGRIRKIHTRVCVCVCLCVRVVRDAVYLIRTYHIQIGS